MADPIVEDLGWEPNSMAYYIDSKVILRESTSLTNLVDCTLRGQLCTANTQVFITPPGSV